MDDWRPPPFPLDTRPVSDREERSPMRARREPTPGPPCPAVPETYDPTCIECGAACDVFTTRCRPCVDFPLLPARTGTEA